MHVVTAQEKNKGKIGSSSVLMCFRDTTCGAF